MDNLIIRKFRQQLIATVNASTLQIEIKRLVMQDVLREVEGVAEAEINKEYSIMQAEQEKKKTEEGGKGDPQHPAEREELEERKEEEKNGQS